MNVWSVHRWRSSCKPDDDDCGQFGFVILIACLVILVVVSVALQLYRRWKMDQTTALAQAQVKISGPKARTAEEIAVAVPRA